MLKSKSSPIRKTIFTTILLFFIFFIFSLYKREIANVRYSTIDAWESSPFGDCALVLTGGPGRLKEGFDLLVRGQVKKLIISGVNPQATIHELFPQMVYYPQIQEENIILEKRSETTFGNMQQSLPLIEALQCRSVLLVTSFLHMYRSTKTFQATYPKDITLIPYSVSGNIYSVPIIETLIEATKSIFYSFWAYNNNFS